MQLMWLVGVLVTLLALLPLAVSADQLSTNHFVSREGRTVINKEDLQKISQLVIELKALQPYYHVDELPDRKPLVIMTNDVMRTGPPLRLFGHPVLYLHHPGSRPYFEFRKILVEKGLVSVEFRYPIEGIRGVVRLSKQSGGWAVESHTIVEE